MWMRRRAWWSGMTSCYYLRARSRGRSERPPAGTAVWTPGRPCESDCVFVGPRRLEATRLQSASACKRELARGGCPTARLAECESVHERPDDAAAIVT